MENFNLQTEIDIDQIIEKKYKERISGLGKLDKDKENVIKKEVKQIQSQNIIQDILPLILEKAKVQDNQTLNQFRKFENDKDFFYNLMILSADYYCRKNSSGCESVFAGVDYGIIKSYIKKKIILDEHFSGQDSVSLEDLKKMTLKERLSLKKDQETKNMNNNIYSDIKRYITTEIKSVIPSANNYEINHDNLYEQVVIKDVNNILINNIISDKKFYVGLVVISNERFDHFVETIKETKNNLNKV